jgi:predicted DNA-binding transcriptional regulator
VGLAEQLGRTVFLLAQGTYKAREFRSATYLVAVEVGMALKGNLRDFSVTQLLNLINLARKTGTLAIDTRETQARLCFKEGKLIYAMTDGQDDHLAAMLQRAGKITEEQAHTIQTRADVKSDKELGLLLMNAGYVSKDDIVKSVRTHILNNVYPLFTWSEGTFRFESNVLPFEDRITIPIGLESVIMEGSRRLKEWERLQEELPDLNHALRFADRPEARLRDISLSVEEWRVVSFINPRNTIRQIAQYNNMSDFQIRKIVYGLLQAGLVELVWLEGAVVSAPSATPGQTPVAMHRPAVKRGVVERLIAFFQRS